MRAKIPELEILRGGGILLVVFVHIVFHHYITFLQHFATFFAMPLFFSISGFLYGYKDIKKLIFWKDTLSYIKKKLISLGIPYILFSIIYIVLNFWLNKYVDTNNVSDISDVLLILYSPVAQYWYLWTLLLFFTISSVVLRVKNIKFILLVSVVVDILWYIFNCYTDLTVYSKTIVFYMYFVGSACLGHLYASNNFFSLLKKKEIQCLLFWVEILFIITAFHRLSELDASGLIPAVLQLVNTVFGIIGFLFLMYNICRINIIKKTILVIADYSWYIFILHSYFTSFSKTVLIRVFPNIDIYNYYACSLLFTIVGCIILGYFSKKVKIIDFMFFPQKYFVIKKHFGIRKSV